MTTLQIIFIVGFSFGMILDILIKSNYLGSWVLEKYLYFCRFSYFTMYLLFFIISFFIFIILSYFHVGFISEMEVYINIIDDHFYIGDGEAGGSDNSSSQSNENKSSGEISNSIDPNVGGVNVENILSAPNGTIQLGVEKAIFKVPVEGINNVVAAGSSAGGAALGVKTAQLVGGSPMMKAAAGLGVMAAVQTTTIIMSKALNNSGNKKAKDPNVNNFIGDLLNNTDSKLLADKYTEFPLNLLTDLNTLVNLEILVLILLIYVLLGQLIINVEFEKYMPNNRLGKLLLLLLNRYKNIWTTSKNFLLVSCFIILIICVFSLKLGFYFILNS